MWSETTQALLSLFDPAVRGVTCVSLSDVDEASDALVVTTPTEALRPDEMEVAVP